jgi:hypothetical protein
MFSMNDISNKTSPNDSRPIGSSNTAAVEAVQRLLRPLVRLLLAKHDYLSIFNRVIKTPYLLMWRLKNFS